MKRRRITAENITAISAAAAGAGKPYPDPGDLLRALSDRLSGQASDYARRRAAAPEGTLGHAFNVAAARAAARPARLERLLRDMPRGTRLCAVYYKPVPPEQRRAVEAEFMRGVLPRFLKYIARHHKGYLRNALGHSDHNIACMSFGLLPKDEQGRILAFGVDHQIQRGGGGALCGEKARDPRQKGADRKFRVNDFSNLEYVSDAQHACKNEWLALQEVSKLPPEGGWILYPVTERRAAPPFFAPAQDAGHPLAGTAYKPERVEQAVSLASLRVRQALRHVLYFQRHPSASRMIRAFCALAESRGTTVTGLMEVKRSGRRPLPDIFRDFAAWDTGLRGFAQRKLVPALEETTQAMTRAASLTLGLDLGVSRNRTAFGAFTSFYHSRHVFSLRRTAENLPFREAAAFVAATHEIDGKIARVRMEDYLKKPIVFRK